MDISYVIRHVRILRYFLRTVLDKDQRVLLKLKSTEYIKSSEDERKGDANRQKVRHKDLILKRYVEEIQKKTLGKADIRLLEVLGFNDAIKILTEEKAKQIEHEKQMDRRAHLDGGHLGGQGNEDRDVNQDMNVLGSGSYERSQTKTQRNPNAEKLAENW